MADIEKIRNVAKRVIRAKEAGNDVVVVLSAMAGETNKLVQMANTASGGEPDWREYDVLVSSGEQVSISLFSIVLNKMGYKAISLLGYQVKIVCPRRSVPR